MKEKLTTHDFVEYIKETNGCLNLKCIHYELYAQEFLQKGDANSVILEGTIEVTPEAHELVLGTHKSGKKYGSTVGAMLDIVNPVIKNFAIQRLEGDLQLSEISNEQRVLKEGEYVRRLKAIVWGPTHIDREANEIWVKGVI